MCSDSGTWSFRIDTRDGCSLPVLVFPARSRLVDDEEGYGLIFNLSLEQVLRGPGAAMYVPE